MTRGAELRQALREALSERLAVRGWRPVAPRLGLTLAAYVRELDADFAAAVELQCGGVFPDRHVLLNLLLTGVSYEPLRRLSPLLGGRLGLVPRFDCEILNLHEGDEPWLPHLDCDGQIDSSADRLAELVEARSSRCANRTWSIDEVLACTPDGVLDRAALLAAAGRRDQAYEALSRFRPSVGAFGDEQRAVYQLRRWLDGGCDPALIPADSQAPPEPDLPPFRDIRKASKDRDAAVERVRDRAAGRDREALRALLEEELERAGVAGPSPLWFERALDDLQRSPAERARARLDALTSLAGVGVGAVRVLRRRQLPDTSTPDWLEPPSPAFYEPPCDRRRWIAVALDESALDWLEAARAALPRLASLHAWLRVDEDDALIAVCIGERRVGHIAADTAAATFRAAIAEASFRGELVRLRARLTARSRDATGHLLELAVPIEPSHRA